jgi:hypothetical protein
MKYLVRESKMDIHKDLIRRTVDKATCTKERETPSRSLVNTLWCEGGMNVCRSYLVRQ